VKFERTQEEKGFVSFVDALLLVVVSCFTTRDAAAGADSSISINRSNSN
jgi:hypothetical protein